MTSIFQGKGKDSDAVTKSHRTLFRSRRGSLEVCTSSSLFGQGEGIYLIRTPPSMVQYGSWWLSFVMGGTGRLMGCRYRSGGYLLSTVFIFKP